MRCHVIVIGGSLCFYAAERRTSGVSGMGTSQRDGLRIAGEQGNGNALRDLGPVGWKGGQGLLSKFVTRNSSEDEIANVNFLYDDIVHAPQNTIHWCINSATDQHGYALERRFNKFSEITQCNDHYTVQGHSRSPILVAIESSYTTSY